MALPEDVVDEIMRQVEESVDLMAKEVAEILENGHRPSFLIFVVDAESGDNTWILRGMISKMAWIGWLQFLMNSVIAHNFTGKVPVEQDHESDPPLENGPVAAEGRDSADPG